MGLFKKKSRAVDLTKMHVIQKTPPSRFLKVTVNYAGAFGRDTFTDITEIRGTYFDRKNTVGEPFATIALYNHEILRFYGCVSLLTIEEA